MSKFEGLALLPDLLDEVHRRAAVRRLGEYGVRVAETASWSMMEAADGFWKCMDFDIVNYDDDVPIGELFGAQQALYFSSGNERIIRKHSASRRKWERYVFTKSMEDESDITKIIIPYDAPPMALSYAARRASSMNALPPVLTNARIFETIQREMGDTGVVLVSNALATKMIERMCQVTQLHTDGDASDLI